MSIQKISKDQECEFIVSGRVDGALANQLEVEVLTAMREGFRKIFLNLAEVTFLCSAGIRVVLQYHRQMKNQGRVLLVSRYSPEVDQVLEMTGFKANIVESV